MKQLSIVAASRNDDHGGKLLHRMQLFINGLVAQCNRYKIDAELILVEWNPPADRPRLSEALQWPENNRACAIRIIEVPEEVHQRFKHSEGLPLFQMIAKNVGIRRAHGRFILATNIDILFSDELAQFLGRERLKPKRLYRIDRYDVYGDIPTDQDIDGLLGYCRNHVLRINRRQYSKNLVTGEIRRNREPLNPYVYFKTYIRNWRKSEYSRKSLPLMFFRYAKYLVSTGYQRLDPRDPQQLHTNACGDFTLMDTASWQALRGYWEWEGYSMHLDTHLLLAARLAGVRQQILKAPMQIYHIEHEVGSGYTPEGKDVLYNRISKAGIPILDVKSVIQWAKQVRLKKEALHYNGEDWGLADDDLEEICIGD